MIKSFPKVFSIGTDYIRDLFNHPVEITEKVDGSQYCFGKDPDNNLYMRSKGKQLFPEFADKNFMPAINHTLAIQDIIPKDTVFYCETLARPHHNSLTYNRIPRNNLYLFGVSDYTGTKFDSNLNYYADLLCIDRAVVLNNYFESKIDSFESIKEILNMESYLGGPKIEGFVVKNYYNPFLLGGQPIPVMAGKFISEQYKEISRQSWGKENTSKGKWEVFKDSYLNQNRWEKAIQHLRDDGILINDPKDIGILLKEIQRDIIEEEKETIKNFLWSEFGKELLRHSVRGFAEYYKEKLLSRSFNE